MQLESSRILPLQKCPFKTSAASAEIPLTFLLYFSANFDFKSQFTTGYDYNTPTVPDSYKDTEGNLPAIDKLPREDQVNLWKDARSIKSGFLAPAYTNLALGIDYTPTKWLSVNFAPLTGGYVIVKDASLRKNYSMKEKKSTTQEMLDEANAMAELNKKSATGDVTDLMDKYENAPSAAIEDELAALKARLGK